MFVSFMLNLLCFGLGLIDCAPRLRNICIKEIFGFYGRCCPNFFKTYVFVLAITWSSLIRIE